MGKEHWIQEISADRYGTGGATFCHRNLEENTPPPLPASGLTARSYKDKDIATVPIGTFKCGRVKIPRREFESVANCS